MAYFIDPKVRERVLRQSCLNGAEKVFQKYLSGLLAILDVLDERVRVHGKLSATETPDYQHCAQTRRWMLKEFGEAAVWSGWNPDDLYK